MFGDANPSDFTPSNVFGAMKSVGIDSSNAFDPVISTDTVLSNTFFVNKSVDLVPPNAFEGDSPDGMDISNDCFCRTTISSASLSRDYLPLAHFCEPR
jgi:hypothetical protein